MRWNQVRFSERQPANAVRLINDVKVLETLLSHRRFVNARFAQSQLSFIEASFARSCRYQSMDGRWAWTNPSQLITPNYRPYKIIHNHCHLVVAHLLRSFLVVTRATGFYSCPSDRLLNAFRRWAANPATDRPLKLTMTQPLWLNVFKFSAN